MYPRTKAEDMTHIVYATTGAGKIYNACPTDTQARKVGREFYFSRNTVVPRLGGRHEDEPSGSSDGESRK